MNESSRITPAPRPQLPALVPEAGTDLSDFLSTAALAVPDYIGPPRPAEHMPFLFWLCHGLRPRLVVEAGAVEPSFHFALCQAVSQSALEAACHLVGLSLSSTGDRRKRLLRGWAGHQNAQYASFARMGNGGPAEAATQFAEGSIDLLVLHSGNGDADALAREWYQTLKPRLSTRAVVLVHRVDDAAPPLDGELDGLPAFRFPHGGGLGLFAAGAAPPALVRHLCAQSGARAEAIRALYARLGLASRQAVDARRLKRCQRELEDASTEAEGLREERGLLLARLVAREDELVELGQRVEHHRGKARRAGRLEEKVARKQGQYRVAQENIRELQRELEQCRQAAAAERERADAVRAELDAVVKSSSWRLTAPIRALLGRVRAR